MKSQAVPLGLSAPRRDRAQEVGDDFGARLRPEIAFAVDATAHGIRVHVALFDHELGMDFHLLGALDFAVDLAKPLSAKPRRRK